MAQTMGKCMEAAMKSLALGNSPWSVEMETNFQLALFPRPFFRTYQVDMTSLSNLKRANASISYLQNVYHQGKKQSKPLDWKKKNKTLATERDPAPARQGNSMLQETYTAMDHTLENSFDCSQTSMSLCKYTAWLTSCESQIINERCHKAQSGEGLPI